MGIKQVKSIVIAGNGTNCEMETAHACRLAGSDIVDIIHISDLISNRVCLDQYHFLNLPGGFLDGDDLGAAQVGANRIKSLVVTSTGEKLYTQFQKFIEDGKLILGICNGFQLMVKLGLLPGFGGNHTQRLVTLILNDSGRFEDRWVYLKINEKSKCIFTKDIKGIYLPVRHGEGKFIPEDTKVMNKLMGGNHIAAQYCDKNYRLPTMDYPWNPNGSIDAVAGICDETGRIMGMMPHPEAYLHYTNHPRWTRENLPEEGMGLQLFRKAINYIRENLL